MSYVTTLGDDLRQDSRLYISSRVSCVLPTVQASSAVVFMGVDRCYLTQTEKETPGIRRVMKAMIVSRNRVRI